MTTLQKESSKHRRYLTTGDISRLMDVAPRTVTIWIDSDLLRGFKIPGSNHRRVRPMDLLDFCREQKLPFPPEIAPGVVVLSPCADDLAAKLRATLGANWRVYGAVSPLAAGVFITEHSPVIFVVDVMVGRYIAGEAARDAKQCSGCPVVVLLAEDSSEPLNGETVENRFGWPVDVARVAKRLEGMVWGK